MRVISKNTVLGAKEKSFYFTKHSHFALIVGPKLSTFKAILNFHIFWNYSFNKPSKKSITFFLYSFFSPF